MWISNLCNLFMPCHSMPPLILKRFGLGWVGLALLPHMPVLVCIVWKISYRLCTFSRGISMLSTHHIFGTRLQIEQKGSQKGVKQTIRTLDPRMNTPTNYLNSNKTTTTMIILFPAVGQFSTLVSETCRSSQTAMHLNN